VVTNTVAVNSTGGTTSKTATKVTFWIILTPFLQPMLGERLGNALELYDNVLPPKWRQR
jgi:hypothetical protein